MGPEDRSWPARRTGARDAVSGLFGAPEFMAATFLGHEQVRDLALDPCCDHDRPGAASACARAALVVRDL
jgi:hypothetical protein